jgi:NAD(P)-dependent dehydrogenase (short-subunit alcohol dehydrogenase family)
MITYNFEGKVFVVSGGSGDLGRAVIEKLSGAGAKVLAPRRAASKSHPAAGRQDVTSLTLEAEDEASVKSFFETVKHKEGRIDGLVNMVGGYHAGEPVSNLLLEVFEKQIDLNLKSAFLLTKYAVQAMSESGGKIVHLASRAAVDKGANSFPYSTSKLGVLRLVEAVAIEARDQNININAVLPSIIDTAINREAMPKANFAKWPKPEQIASVIAFLVSEESELISGAAIPVYGKF